MAASPTPSGAPAPGFLARLALFARRRYRWIFAVAGGLLVLSALLTARLRFDTDILNLLPQKDPVVRTFLDTLEDFSSVDYLLVAVRVPEGAVLDPYESFVDELGQELEGLPQLESVEYKLTGTRELLRELFPKAVLFLDEAGRQELADRLSQQGIQDRVREVRRMLGTPQGQATKPLLQLDPFGLSDLFIEQVQSSRGSLSVDWASGYYLSRDRRMLLILAKPSRPPADVDAGAEMVAAIESVVERTLVRWPELAGGLGPVPGDGVDLGDELTLESELPPPPEVALGGSHLTAVDDARFIRRDGVVGAITSLFLCAAALPLRLPPSRAAALRGAAARRRVASDLRLLLLVGRPSELGHQRHGGPAHRLGHRLRDRLVRALCRRAPARRHAGAVARGDGRLRPAAPW